MENTTTPQANGQGDSALRSNWSTYVSLLKADLAEQSSVAAYYFDRAGNGGLSARECDKATNAVTQAKTLRELLLLIGEEVESEQELWSAKKIQDHNFEREFFFDDRGNVCRS